MNKIKNLIRKMKKGFSSKLENIFSDRRRTIKFVAILIFTVLFLLQISNILIRNSFYNNYSDDVLQYYTGMVDFISALKDGSLSWFNLNNYYGASFFSDVYYVPLDIFTAITFVLSYVMPIGVAYSTTELIKIFIGVMLFAHYLSLNNMKNRTIFWMSILYFIGGGTVSFMAFPVFLSLTVYMPLALIVIHHFFKRKKWLVPLFALMVIFYDFYLGYTLLAFICFAFILEYVKRQNFKFFRFIKDLIIFVALLLLGVLMSAIILYPSVLFILEETYRGTSSFTGWLIYEDLEIFGHLIDIRFFDPDIYFRMLAKIFVEQRPVGFYGFQNSYALEHVSLYISIIGFVYMNYIFFMRDKVSRIYKVAILFALIFMWFPFFSYVFSGTLDAPYTRWINMLPIFQLMILAHVFDRFGFEKIKMWKMTIIVTILLGIVAYLIMYYSQELAIDRHLAARQMLGVDQILMIVAAGYLVLFLIFGWLKKWTVVKFFLWVEIIVAVTYIYSGSFYIRNKIDTFDNAQQIEAFLDEELKYDDEFYRVFVDVNNLGVEDTNFNRMTGYATNTGIFHSWTDSETNGISKLLYNVNEYQSKNKMNSYVYYVNHFLSYKYILVDVENNYDFDSEYFELLSANSKYRLYEIKNTSPFKVYETYLDEDEFTTFRIIYSNIATQKVFVDNAIIDIERYSLDDINIEMIDPDSTVKNSTVRAYSTLDNGVNEVTTGIYNDSSRLFYKYDISDFVESGEVGALYIKMTSVTVEDFDEVYMVFDDGSTKSCTTPLDQSHDIKCEFSDSPTYLYIEDTDEMFFAPAINIRYEVAISGAAYMVYDLTHLPLESNSGIMEINFNSSSLVLEKAFVLDESGNKFDCLNGFYSYNSTPLKLYIYKSSKMYDQSNPFNLSIKVAYDTLEDSIDYVNQEFVKDQYLSVENGKIELWYVNLSETLNDQIVVIPVCYSDDWVFTDGHDYETMSVNGGFLGIVVPNGIDYVSIQMEFAPKGLDIGGFATFSGIAIYLGIFMPSWIRKIKRKNGDDVV